MRAIVIEGAKGASEYQLWDQMVQEKCPGLQHYLGLRWGVCPASGNGGILTCYYALRNMITPMMGLIQIYWYATIPQLIVR